MIGIPAHDFVLAVQVSMRYFPLLAQSAERIAKAQASRGADWSPAGWNILQRVRQITPLIIPLFVTSLRRAENMALAMDARGYGSLPLRTSMIVLRFTALDAAALALGVLLVVVMTLL
jgi:energy-coupling factor transport system permease protein